MTDDLVARITRLQATAPAQVVRLPVWHERVRAVPTGVLRSALFGCVQKGKRGFLDRETVASIAGVTITHTGVQLDQGDLDTWKHCLHLARHSPLGQRIHFSAYSALKAMGRNTGKTQHEWLRHSLERLQASVVEITDTKGAYSGRLLRHLGRDSQRRYVIEIDPRIRFLFDEDRWTGLAWGQRHALRGKPLAQWLHAFYSSHPTPPPHPVDTLKSLCGNQARDLREFRRQLRKAMQEVQVVTGWAWCIDGDLLKVDKDADKDSTP